MDQDNLKIGIEYETRLHNNVLLTLNAIPYSTIIYTAMTDKVYLNKFAMECLEIKESDTFDLNRWRKLNPHLTEIGKKIDKDILFDQKTLITFHNGKKEMINFNISLLRNTGIGDIYIIYFNKASAKYAVSSISSLYMIRDEVKKLKPYLNNTGKSMLDELMNKYFYDERKSLTIEDLTYYEKEMHAIQSSFPFLSHQEIIICSLLVNNMDNNEISALTKKSLNSIFVMIHRLNKKLNVKDRTELMRLLHGIVENRIRKDHNLPSIEEFDF